MPTVVAAPQPAESRKSFTHAAIVIVVGVLATTLAQSQVLARLPIQNLLKNELHASRADNARFFFLAGLAWYFKPFAGILTDAFPFFGSRRKSYILASTLLGVLFWGVLFFTPHDYNKMLYVCIVINCFMVIASTVIGGYMVEVAQAMAGSGRLTAIRQFVQQACYIINGPAAGYLASIWFGWTAAACGGVLALLVPVTIFFLHEKRISVASSQLLSNAGVQMKKIGKAKTMWAAAGMMALFYIAPGLYTAVLYRQQDVLHMDVQRIGFLQLISGVCGVTAAIVYGFACRKFPLRTLLVVCLFAGMCSNLVYLGYSTVFRAQVIEGLNGFGYTLAELALMDLAVRATPRGSEGLGFSLMMSVRNLALFGTDWLGSKLMDSYHWSFSSLVLGNAGTTILTVPLVFLLPLVLVRGRDAEIVGEAAAPRGALED